MRPLAPLIPLVPALLAALAPRIPAQGHAAPEVHDLGAGAVLVTLHGTDEERADICLDLGLGAVEDPRAAAVLATLLGHALGSACGLEARVEVRPDRVRVAASGEPSRMDAALLELAGALADPARVAGELDAALAAVAAESAPRRDRLATAAVWRTAWGVDIVRALPPGRSDLQGLSAADLAGFLRAHATPARLHLGWSGPGDATDLPGRLRAALAELGPGEAPAAPALDPYVPGQLRLFVLDDPGDGPVQIRVVVPAAPYPSASHTAARIWAQVLDGPEVGVATRLAAMDIDGTAAVETTGDPLLAPFIIIRASAARDQAARALEGILITMDDARARLPGRALKEARDVVRTREQERSSRPGGALERALDLVHAGLDPADPWPALERGLGRLREEVVREIGLKIAPPRQTSAVAVGPAAQLRPSLEHLAPVIELSSGVLERSPAGDAAAERLLAALGGAAAWSATRALHSTRSETVRLSDDVTEELELELWTDLHEPRQRLRSRFRYTTTITILRKTRAWERSPLETRELDAFATAKIQERRSRDLPVLLHGLATGAALGLTLDEEERLVVHDPAGLVGVFDLGPDGRPLDMTWVTERGLRGRRFLEWTELDLDGERGLVLPRRYEWIGEPRTGEISSWEHLAEFDPELLETD